MTYAGTDPVLSRALSALRGHAPAILALTESGLVFACSAAARRDGVVRGLKLREAQYRSPALAVLDYDMALDVRVFEPVVRRASRSRWAWAASASG